MSRVIAVTSNKGGVGKTTTVVNLGECLAQCGYRVLLVDLDPQNGLTFGLGLENIRQEPGLFEILLHGGDIGSRVVGLDTEGLDALLGGPSAALISDLDVLMSNDPQRLATTLVDLRHRYHFILLDCPAGFGGLATAALATADEALVPIQCHPLALRTLPVILERLQSVRGEQNPRLALSGVLLTMYDPALDAHEKVAQQVWAAFPPAAVFKTAIPRSDHFVSQFRGGGPVAYGQPESEGAMAYQKLARELVERQVAR